MRGVRFSPGFKWLILLLLPLTLAWKLAVPPGERASNDGDIQARVADFLNRQHFAVAAPARVEWEKPMLRATAGTCRILIAKVNPIAWDRDLIRQNASVEDRFFIVFHGTVYSAQPTWLTAADFLWSRLRRELGLDVRSMGPLAVIAATSCDAERLPWHELG